MGRLRLAAGVLLLVALAAATGLSLQNRITIRRLLREEAALRAEVAKAGLVGKPASDFRAFATARGLRCSPTPAAVSAGHRIVASAERGWTLDARNGMSVYSTLLFGELDASGRVVGCEVVTGGRIIGVRP